MHHDLPDRIACMETADIKVDGQHLRLSAGSDRGGVAAIVHDFTANREVLRDSATTEGDAKKICEAFVKGRFAQCPPIEWAKQRRPVVFTVT